MLNARHRWSAVLIVLASGVFAVGVALERSEEDSESPAHVEAEAEESHVEGEEAEGLDETEGEGGEEEESETLLGIDLESTPLVILAVLGSLALAAGVWLRPDLGWLLVLVGVAMGAFAILDVREFFHLLDESREGIAVLAALVAVLHATAAWLALSRREPQAAR